MRNPVAIAITLAALIVSGSAVADPEDAGPPLRPYTTPLTPTGQLLHRHEFQRGSSVAMAFEIGGGITDRVELRLRSELIVAGELELRIGLLPRASKFQVVVGGSVAGTLINGPKAWAGGSLAVACSGDDWQLHAATKFDVRLGSGSGFAATTAGLMGRIGRHGLLFVEVGQVAWSERLDCGTAARTAPEGPTPAPCSERTAATGGAFGFWWNGANDPAYGISAILFAVGDTVIPIFPVLSMSWTD